MNLDEIFGIIKEEDKVEEEIIDEIFKKDEKQIEEVIEREPSIEDCIEELDDLLDNAYVFVELVKRSEKTSETLDNLAEDTKKIIANTEKMIEELFR